MPAFTSLPEQEIDPLANYLMLLNRLGPLTTGILECYNFLTSEQNPLIEKLPTCA